jgi:exonuclease SbcD
VASPPVPGLADALRERFPTAVEVVLAGHDAEARRPQVETRSGRSPQELFAAYLAEADATDAAVEALFSELVDEVLSG